MVKIVSAASVSDEDLRLAMLDAFSDYAMPLKLNVPAFAFMMQQRGLDRSSSRVALVDGQVAAIWLVSVRDGEAYLIASGTRPPFRACGIARSMADDCIAQLKPCAVRSFQTEVFRTNEAAAKLYYSLGMAQNRLLDCYAVPAHAEAAAPPAGYVQANWPDVKAAAARLRDWAPSWQNDDRSVDAADGQQLCVTLSDEKGVVGYAVATRETRAVHQLAVRKDARRAGVGAGLIRALQFHLSGAPLLFINVQQDRSAFAGLMKHVGATMTVEQFELRMEL